MVEPRVEIEKNTFLPAEQMSCKATGERVSEQSHRPARLKDLDVSLVSHRA